MHIDYDTAPKTLAQQTALLESLCEGYVRAHMLEIGINPDAFPCCVKCGKFACKQFGPFSPQGTGISPKPNERKRFGRNFFRNPLWPGSELAATTSSSNENIATVRVQSPSSLANAKIGTALDLAVFQCAQERRRDKTCFVQIVPDNQGRLHALVVYADGTVKDPRDDAVSQAACACGMGHG